MEKDVEGLDYQKLAKKVCHRNFGIGADGMFVVAETNEADVWMKFYNADGSIASMCGNATRCFALYVRNNELVPVDKEEISIKTGAGIMTVTTSEVNGEFSAKVNMGLPTFTPANIPVKFDGDEYIEQDITSFDKTFKISGCLMGVPHMAIFTDELYELDIKKYGSDIETKSIFPMKTNVNFAKIEEGVMDRVDIITWERGAGQTYACGTGVCGTVVLGNYLGKLGKKVDAKVPGGMMSIELTDEAVYMIGPAEKICEGLFSY
jgi:diaminopimelate epimerase